MLMRLVLAEEGQERVVLSFKESGIPVFHCCFLVRCKLLWRCW